MEIRDLYEWTGQNVKGNYEEGGEGKDKVFGVARRSWIAHTIQQLKRLNTAKQACEAVRNGYKSSRAACYSDAGFEP